MMDSKFISSESIEDSLTASERSILDFLRNLNGETMSEFVAIQNGHLSGAIDDEAFKLKMKTFFEKWDQ